MAFCFFVITDTNKVFLRINKGPSVKKNNVKTIDVIVGMSA